MGPDVGDPATPGASAGKPRAPVGLSLEGRIAVVVAPTPPSLFGRAERLGAPDAAVPPAPGVGDRSCTRAMARAVGDLETPPGHGGSVVVVAPPLDSRRIRALCPSAGACGTGALATGLNEGVLATPGASAGEPHVPIGPALHGRITAEAAPSPWGDQALLDAAVAGEVEVSSVGLFEGDPLAPPWTSTNGPRGAYRPALDGRFEAGAAQTSRTRLEPSEHSGALDVSAPLAPGVADRLHTRAMARAGQGSVVRPALGRCDVEAEELVDPWRNCASVLSVGAGRSGEQLEGLYDGDLATPGTSSAGFRVAFGTAPDERFVVVAARVSSSRSGRSGRLEAQASLTPISPGMVVYVSDNSAPGVGGGGATSGQRCAMAGRLGADCRSGGAVAVWATRHSLDPVGGAAPGASFSGRVEVVGVVIEGSRRLPSDADSEELCDWEVVFEDGEAVIDDLSAFSDWLLELPSGRLHAVYDMRMVGSLLEVAARPLVVADRDGASSGAGCADARPRVSVLAAPPKRLALCPPQEDSEDGGRQLQLVANRARLAALEGRPARGKLLALTDEALWALLAANGLPRRRDHTKVLMAGDLVAWMEGHGEEALRLPEGVSRVHNPSPTPSLPRSPPPLSSSPMRQQASSTPGVDASQPPLPMSGPPLMGDPLGRASYDVGRAAETLARSSSNVLVALEAVGGLIAKVKGGAPLASSDLLALAPLISGCTATMRVVVAGVTACDLRHASQRVPANAAAVPGACAAAPAVRTFAEVTRTSLAPTTTQMTTLTTQLAQTSQATPTQTGLRSPTQLTTRGRQGRQGRQATLRGVAADRSAASPARRPPPQWDWDRTIVMRPLQEVGRRQATRAMDFGRALDHALTSRWGCDKVVLMVRRTGHGEYAVLMTKGGYARARTLAPIQVAGFGRWERLEEARRWLMSGSFVLSVVPLSRSPSDLARELASDNASRWSGVSQELIDKGSTVDVLLIQDPPLSVAMGRTGLPGFRLVVVPGTDSMNPQAAILIRDSLWFRSVRPFGPRVAAAELMGPSGSTVVISAYIRHTSGEGLDDLRRAVVWAQGHSPRLVIGMDANGHSPLWGPEDIPSNAVGRALEELIMEHNLEVVNDLDAPPSFVSDQGVQSWIDFTLATRSAALGLADWARGILRAHDHDSGCEGRPVVETREEADRMMTTLTEVLQGAIDALVPEKRICWASKPWWSPHLTELRRHMKHLRNRADRLNTDHDRGLFRRARKAFTQEVKKTGEEQWVVEDPDKARVLQARFFPEAPSTQEFRDLAETRREEVDSWLAEEWEAFPPIQEFEVRRRILEMRAVSAPGADGILAKCLQECSDSVTPVLQTIFDGLVRSGSHPSSWRAAK
ncbi:unnamed protein product, partial [Ostreobium quekettii]